ncbi:MAG: hypothetical protein HRF48_06755, partial [Chloroflexota bacterium]
WAGARSVHRQRGAGSAASASHRAGASPAPISSITSQSGAVASAARLPFVAVLARAGESQRLALLAEWQAQGSDLALRPLLATEGDGWALARDGSAHPLDLPPGFWG